ncbi:MAG: Fic family protein [Clostridia bacterium]|nr:Fic family protein [Clostridia bacterium]
MREFDYEKWDQALYTPEIINFLTQIHEYKGKQELYITADSDMLSAMLDIAKIQSVGSSNLIEGIYTSDKRLKALVQEKIEPKNRSEQEIAGYRKVLNEIHESYDYIPIRPNTILQLHRDLYSYGATLMGGNWKNADIDKLCKSFQKAMNEGLHDPLILIPIFILDFLCIHPFNDGNGRMSRLLTLLLLYRSGYMVGKYISIEQIIEKTKENYYDALQECSANWHQNTNKYSPFVAYYLSVILNAYGEFTSRVEHLKYRTLSKPERIKSIISERVGKFTRADLLTFAPDISESTLRKTLAKLLEEGYITKIGSTRNAEYVRNYEKS